MAKKTKTTPETKPLIETIINTTALALTAYGVTQITVANNPLSGYVAVLCGMGLEFTKYWGRNHNWW